MVDYKRLSDAKKRKGRVSIEFSYLIDKGESMFIKRKYILLIVGLFLITITYRSAGNIISNYISGGSVTINVEGNIDYDTDEIVNVITDETVLSEDEIGVKISESQLKIELPYLDEEPVERVYKQLNNMYGNRATDMWLLTELPMKYIKAGALLYLVMIGYVIFFIVGTIIVVMSVVLMIKDLHKNMSETNAV